MNGQHRNIVTSFALTLAGILALGGCGMLSDQEESVSELTAGVVSGAVNATENSGTVTALHSAPAPWSEKAFRSFETLFGLSSAVAAGACQRLRDMDCDPNGAIRILFNRCTRGIAEWSGAENFQFDSPATCEARTGTLGVPTSGHLVRKLEDETKREYNGRSITFYSDAASGYETAVSGGIDVEYGEDAGAPLRQIRILGIRHVGQGRLASVRWDQSVSTDASSPLVVRHESGRRIVESGVVVTQHNLLKFTAETTVLTALEIADGCCHPVSGELQSALSGSKAGTQRLRFGPACGDATLIAEDGSEASLQLRNCF